MNKNNLPALSPFLTKLVNIVSVCPPQIAAWDVEGRKFIVYKESFETHILPSFFSGTLKTFVRQLHFYGFRKQELQGGRWCFFHDSFRKGRPDLVVHIKRRASVKSGNYASRKECASLKKEITGLKEYMNKIERNFKKEVEELKLLLSQERKRKLSLREMNNESSLDVPSRNVFRPIRPKIEVQQKDEFQMNNQFQLNKFWNEKEPGSNLDSLNGVPSLYEGLPVEKFECLDIPLDLPFADMHYITK
eukprot:maker-scaffold_16-snap-gene-6.27-mRNA-1 protein AED:0.00 eAED:0.00 QI:67/1/1/1/1/1/2/283/246